MGNRARVMGNIILRLVVLVVVLSEWGRLLWIPRRGGWRFTGGLGRCMCAGVFAPRIPGTFLLGGFGFRLGLGLALALRLLRPLVLILA